MRRWMLILAISGCLGLPAGTAAPTETLAETLEQGIFKEETARDLIGAIEIYQRVIADADQARALGAQAQFRIGQCLRKLERNDEAETAFRKLIERYPEQTELVAQARKFLPDSANQLQLAGLQPTWKSGERQVLEMRLASGHFIGLIGTRIVESSNDDQSTWQMFVRTYIAGGANQGLSFVQVDRESNRPQQAKFDHLLLGRFATRYEPEQIIIQRLPPMVASPELRSVPLELGASVVANDQCYYLFRQLPLAVGYQTMVPIRDGISGGSPIDVKLEVPRKETLEVPFGKFECFRVELNIGQTFWISDRPERYIVQFEAGGVAGRLAHVVGAEPNALTDPTSGTSVTIPNTWFGRVGSLDDDVNGVFLIDSERMTSAMLIVRPKAQLKAGWGDSIDAWANGEQTQLSNRVQSLKLRADGQQKTRLAGADGLRRIYDGMIGKHAFVACEHYAVSGDRAIQFSVLALKEDFDEALPVIDQLRESVKVE